MVRGSAGIGITQVVLDIMHSQGTLLTPWALNKTDLAVGFLASLFIVSYYVDRSELIKEPGINRLFVHVFLLVLSAPVIMGMLYLPLYLSIYFTWMDAVPAHHSTVDIVVENKSHTHGSFYSRDGTYRIKVSFKDTSVEKSRFPDEYWVYVDSAMFARVKANDKVSADLAEGPLGITWIDGVR